MTEAFKIIRTLIILKTFLFLLGVWAMKSLQLVATRRPLQGFKISFDVVTQELGVAADLLQATKGVVVNLLRVAKVGLLP